MFDKRVINGSIFVDGMFQKKNIYINGEKIALISQDFLPAEETIDASNNQIIPGLIDPHTHFDLDLGFIRSRDDFASGSQAAIYGGVTTIVDFLSPSSNAKELEETFKERMKEAKDCHTDYAFHATIKNPTGSLEEYVLKTIELGMTSIKLFTTYSDSGRRTKDEDIIELLKLSKKYGVLIEAHIEDDSQINLDKSLTFHDLSDSRPTSSETDEALKLASYVRQYGGKLYMVHLSSGATLKALKEQYSEILNTQFFIESCPQYFSLTKDLLEREDGYLYTFAPPLRSTEEMNLLRDLFDDVYAIGTDHCPFNKEDKHHLHLYKIALGIGGIEQSFSLMHKLFYEKVISKMTSNVAEIQGLKNKGKIDVGFDADFTIYQHEERLLEESHSQADYFVYQNYPVDTRVIRVFLRGKEMLCCDHFHPHKGQYLKGVIE